jgi:hypothetical protein
LDAFRRHQTLLFTAARQLKTKFTASDHTLTGGPLVAFHATGCGSSMSTLKIAQTALHSNRVRTS